MAAGGTQIRKAEEILQQAERILQQESCVDAGFGFYLANLRVLEEKCRVRMGKEQCGEALDDAGNETGGREGRDIDVARSQLTALKKRGGGLLKRLKWAMFAAKCLLCDILRPLRRRK